MKKLMLMASLFVVFGCVSGKEKHPFSSDKVKLAVLNKINGMSLKSDTAALSSFLKKEGISAESFNALVKNFLSERGVKYQNELGNIIFGVREDLRSGLSEFVAEELVKCENGIGEFGEDGFSESDCAILELLYEARIENILLKNFDMEIQKEFTGMKVCHLLDELSKYENNGNENENTK